MRRRATKVATGGGVKPRVRASKQAAPRPIDYKEARNLPLKCILALYQANRWSSAEKPAQLRKALAGSHSLISAWDGPRLVGLGNTLSDGHLVVYYSHMLVHPEYQGRGIGM